eukprot:22642-Eustigmatos_ZCMA.PRE.1
MEDLFGSGPISKTLALEVNTEVRHHPPCTSPHSERERRTAGCHVARGSDTHGLSSLVRGHGH